MFGGVTEVDWTVRGGVRGDAETVPEKRTDEAGGLGTAGAEWTRPRGSRTNELKADEDC